MHKVHLYNTSAYRSNGLSMIELEGHVEELEEDEEVLDAEGRDARDVFVVLGVDEDVESVR